MLGKSTPCVNFTYLFVQSEEAHPAGLRCKEARKIEVKVKHYVELKFSPPNKIKLDHFRNK